MDQALHIYRGRFAVLALVRPLRYGAAEYQRRALFPAFDGAGTAGLPDGGDQLCAPELPARRQLVGTRAADTNRRAGRLEDWLLVAGAVADSGRACLCARHGRTCAAPGTGPASESRNRG